MVESYKKLGISFDRIFAWEANPMDPAKYWEVHTWQLWCACPPCLPDVCCPHPSTKLCWLFGVQEVPPELQSSLNFYNVPLTTNLSDPKCPLNVLKRIYNPGDFVVSVTGTCSSSAVASCALRAVD